MPADAILARDGPRPSGACQGWRRAQIPPERALVVREKEAQKQTRPLKGPGG